MEAEDGVVTTAALHASSAGCTQRPSAAGAHEVVKYSLAVERGVTRSAYAADRAEQRVGEAHVRNRRLGGTGAFMTRHRNAALILSTLDASLPVAH